MAKKKSVDLFGDDVQAPRAQSEFEALLNSAGLSSRGLRVGDRLRGEVLAVNGQEAFVATGTPIDAVMPFGSSPAPKVGDFVEVLVVRMRESEILVKAADAVGGGIDADSLEDAFDMELPVAGVVLESVKGGFRVKIQTHKAFCPISQIDWRCVTPEDYVGKKFEFIITKFERGRDLVVSRRKVLELVRAASEGEFLRSAKTGEIFTGQVFRVEKYGAFVRLESGVEGLVPISELGWGRFNHAQEVVNLQQTVVVKLIRIQEDDGQLRLSFSLKQGGSVMDPWASIESDFPQGSQRDGIVERKESYGLFINISSGVTGLLPRSAWRDAPEGQQYELKRKGDTLKVRIDRLGLEARKLTFALPRDDDDETWREHAVAQAMSGGAGAPQSGGFGTLGDLLKGVKGK